MKGGGGLKKKLVLYERIECSHLPPHSWLQEQSVLSTYHYFGGCCPSMKCSWKCSKRNHFIFHPIRLAAGRKNSSSASALTPQLACSHSSIYTCKQWTLRRPTVHMKRRVTCKGLNEWGNQLSFVWPPRPLAPCFGLQSVFREEQMQKWTPEVTYYSTGDWVQLLIFQVTLPTALYKDFTELILCLSGTLVVVLRKCQVTEALDWLTPTPIWTFSLFFSQHPPALCQHFSPSKNSLWPSFRATSNN